MGLSLRLQQAEHLPHVGSTESLAILEWDLEDRRLQVTEENQEVVGIDQSVLGGALQEVLRVAGQELVDRVAGADQDADRRLVAPPRAAQLLPRRGDAARVAAENGGLHLAHVDAHLEGVGGYHPSHLPAAEAALDLAPLRGQVSATVASDVAVAPAPAAGRRLAG